MSQNKGTLLIVEDEPELRRDISQEMAASGFSILTAGNGREALEILKTQNPHAILTDISMPVMTGLELVQELRKQGIETPCIVLTGYFGKENILDALRLGVVDFIEKPFQYGRLLETVTSAVQLGKEISAFEEQLDEMLRTSGIPIEKQEYFRRAKLAKLILKANSVVKKSA